MDDAASASLYVRFPEQGGQWKNLTTFGSDFFGWNDRTCDIQANVSQLTSYIETRGQPKTLETISALLGEEPSDLIITDSASQSLAITFAYAQMNSLLCWIPRPWFPAYRTLPKIFGCQFYSYDPFNEEEAVGLFNILSPQAPSLVIVNTPSNPLGLSIPASVAGVARTASESSASLVVWDLSYYWVQEPSNEHREGGLRIYSLGKALGLPGMRLGAVACTDQSLKRELEAIKRQIALHSCPLSESIACRIIEDFDVPELQSSWRRKLSKRTSEYLTCFSRSFPGSPIGPFLVERSEVVSKASAIGVSGEAFGLDATETRICLAAPEHDWSAFLINAKARGLT